MTAQIKWTERRQPVVCSDLAGREERKQPANLWCCRDVARTVALLGDWPQICFRRQTSHFGLRTRCVGRYKKDDADFTNQARRVPTLLRRMMRWRCSLLWQVVLPQGISHQLVSAWLARAVCKHPDYGLSSDRDGAQDHPAGPGHPPVGSFRCARKRAAAEHALPPFFVCSFAVVDDALDSSFSVDVFRWMVHVRCMADGLLTVSHTSVILIGSYSFFKCIKKRGKTMAKMASIMRKKAKKEKGEQHEQQEQSDSESKTNKKSNKHTKVHPIVTKVHPIVV